MRQPLSATPPVGHAISRKFQPTPTPWLEIPDDWQNLTDNSIQILSFENSINYAEDSINLANLPYCENNPDNVHTGCLDKMVISLDSVSHRSGLRDEKIVFTPTRCHQNSKKQCVLDMSSVAAGPVRPGALRNSYSDTDIVCNRRTRSTGVLRSQSLYVHRSEDLRMVKPLQPSTYKSKIGSIKRIPSFRATLKATHGSRSHPLSDCFETPVQIYDSTNSEDRRTQANLNTLKFSLMKFVKFGLKSVAKGKDCKLSKLEGNQTFKCQSARRRKFRCGSDIGGLSEFLRRNEQKERNERRKTVAVLPDDLQEKAKTGLHKGFSSAPSALDTTLDSRPKLSMGSRRLQYTGTTNLKLVQTQQTLALNTSAHNATQNTVGTEEDKPEASSTGTARRPRPRLGVLGSMKLVPIRTIDELEMGVVRDLKRRIEKVNRSTKIKTNGSLKFKPRVAAEERSSVPSVRGLHLILQGAGVVNMKRESIV